jgi:glycosyltransferase involved in cell wall biosynthesis
MNKPLTIALVLPYDHQTTPEAGALCGFLEHNLRLEGIEVVKVSPVGVLSEITEGVPAIHGFAAVTEHLLVAPAVLRGKLESLRKKATKADRDFAVLLSDVSLATLSLSLQGFKCALYVHDCSEWAGTFGACRAFGRDGFFQRFTLQTLRSGMLHVQAFIAPSLTTARDIRQLVGSGASVAIATPPPREIFANAKNPPGRQDVLWRRLGIVPPPYFLNVGDASWQKNRLGAVYLLCALKALRPVTPALVFVGERPSAEESTLAHNGGVELYHFANPSDEELATLYKGSLGLLMPSIAEGAGGAALEALRGGTPLVISNTDALAELYADAASIVLPMPTSPTELGKWAQENAPRLEKLLDADADLLASITREGVEYASTFTVEQFRHKVADALLAVAEQ